MIFQKTFLILLHPKLGFSMKAQIIAVITGAVAASVFAVMIRGHDTDTAPKQ